MIVIVGAGAAGLVAAIAAASAGMPVTLLESSADGGRKILISGGGRCNVLPDVLSAERFVTDSPPALLRRLLGSWPLDAQRAFFERDVGVPLTREADTGKWFPASNRARDVRDGLVRLARAKGAIIQFNTRLVDVQAAAGGLRAITDRGAIAAKAVVLATGGLSVPATGSTGTGLDAARRLGHVVHRTYPALTPLVASPALHGHLAGVSLQVHVRAAAAGQTAVADGGFLFTHVGYSGPAVLDVSHVAVRSRDAGTAPATVRVRWSRLDEHAWRRALTGATGLVVSQLAREMPRRLAETLVHESGLPLDRLAAELRRGERTRLIERLVRYDLPWTGDEGYRKAEVTGGGVALDEVDPRTLESRRQPGLFLCGELLDAFGPIGGHNFAWAWATGRLAGLGAATACNTKISG